MAVTYNGPDPEATIRQLLHFGKRKKRDIHERLRLLYAFAHQIYQVRPAGEKARRAVLRASGN
jgi:hypothetical protein